jgi:hypothetical protein
MALLHCPIALLSTYLERELTYLQESCATGEAREQDRTLGQRVGYDTRSTRLQHRSWPTITAGLERVEFE